MEKLNLNGTIACVGKVRGKVYKLEDTSKLAPPRSGCIIVAKFTTPVIAPALIQAVGIICETGGITSHAAIISREFNKPCMVGVKDAMTQLIDGQEIIMDAGAGIIYAP